MSKTEHKSYRYHRMFNLSSPWQCWCSFTSNPWAAKHLSCGYFNSNTSEIISPYTQLGTAVCWTMWPSTKLGSWALPRFAFRVGNRRCWGRSPQWGPCCLKPWREGTWHRASRMGHGSAFCTRVITNWRRNTDSNAVMFHPIKDQAPEDKRNMLMQELNFSTTVFKLYLYLRIFNTGCHWSWKDKTNETSIFLRRDTPTKLLEDQKLVWYGKRKQP